MELDERPNLWEQFWGKAVTRVEVNFNTTATYEFKIRRRKSRSDVQATGSLTPFDARTTTVEGKADVPFYYYPLFLMFPVFGVIIVVLSYTDKFGPRDPLFAVGIMLFYFVIVGINLLISRRQTQKLAREIEEKLSGTIRY
jgi:NADH:ubiquinone oxidoreductase subunit 3 (subunit A)